MQKKKLVALILTVAMLATCSINAFNSSPIDSPTTNSDYEVYSDGEYDGFTLEWDKYGKQDVLTHVSSSKASISYTYDTEKNRIRKNVNGSVTTFEYDSSGNLVEENRDNRIYKYFYKDPYGLGAVLTSFSINDTMYTYRFDENGSVSSIVDISGNEIAKYEYHGTETSVLGLENGVWVDKSSDKSFVGNLNLIRLYGYYFDEETGWYYCHRYYDAKDNRFVDGRTTSISTILFNNEAEATSTLSLTSLEDDVNDRVETLMSSAYYGLPIDYSEDWYEAMNTSELLARLIFGENTNYIADQNAIGYTILNRYHDNDNSGYYPRNLYGIATQANQFSVIIGGANSTINSRVPNTSAAGWEHATYVAVSILYSGCDISKCESLFYRPQQVDNHTQFLSYSMFLDVTRYNSTTDCIQRYTSWDNQWKNLEEVIIPGVGTYNNLTSLTAAYSGRFSGTGLASNIHYLYQ